MLTKKPTETVIEHAYFHTSNGGLTLEVIRSVNPHDDKLVSYRLDGDFYGMGISIPLGSVEVVGWLADALTRVVARMEKEPNRARQWKFDHHKSGWSGIRDGEKREGPTNFRWKSGKGLVWLREVAVPVNIPGIVGQTHQTVDQDDQPYIGDDELDEMARRKAKGSTV